MEDQNALELDNRQLYATLEHALYQSTETGEPGLLFPHALPNVEGEPKREAENATALHPATEEQRVQEMHLLNRTAILSHALWTATGVHGPSGHPVQRAAEEEPGPGPGTATTRFPWTEEQNATEMIEIPRLATPKCAPHRHHAVKF